MRMNGIYKIAVVISVLLLTATALSGSVYAKKPAGSPCYLLHGYEEVGKYTGDLKIDFKNDSVILWSGHRAYRTYDLISFGWSNGTYTFKNDSYVKYEGDGEYYVGGAINKRFKDYKYFFYRYPYVVVTEDSGIWIYNVVKGKYMHRNVHTEKAIIVGKKLYLLKNHKVYYGKIKGHWRHVYLKNVDDFYVAYDIAGFKYKVYARHGIVWFRSNVPNIYKMNRHAEYLNSSEKDMLRRYFDNDEYEKAMDFLQNKTNLSMKDAWYNHLFEERIYYTSVDPNLPYYGQLNPKPSVVYTFPSYKLVGDMVLKIQAKGLGITPYLIRNPILGERYVNGQVHLFVYINGKKIGDVTRSGAAGFDDWHTYSFTLKNSYLKNSDTELDGIKIEFVIEYPGGASGFTNDYVKFVSLYMGNQNIFSDNDNDGVPLAWEYYYGTNPNSYDTDGDGLSDGLEIHGWYITVNGLKDKVKSNPLKKDSDGDSLYDEREYELKTNPESKDTDGDGMPDGWEVEYGLNPVKNDRNGDKDGDGLSNYDEYKLGTNPKNPDTDGDGMPDGWEVEYGLNPVKNDRNGDKDGDGLSNYDEYKLGTNPDEKDTDGDGLSDYFEVKVGWTAWWIGADGKKHEEHVYSNPLSADSDGDGLSDYQEYKLGLNPNNKDTDGDGLSDYEEVQGWYVYSINSMSALKKVIEGIKGGRLGNGEDIMHVTSSPHYWDTDGDGLNDYIEWKEDSNPRSKDTDGDGVSDYREYEEGESPTLVNLEGPVGGISFVKKSGEFGIHWSWSLSDENGISKIVFYRDGSKVGEIDYSGKNSWSGTKYIGFDTGDVFDGATFVLVAYDELGNVRVARYHINSMFQTIAYGLGSLLSKYANDKFNAGEVAGTIRVFEDTGSSIADILNPAKWGELSSGYGKIASMIRSEGVEGVWNALKGMYAGIEEEYEEDANEIGVSPSNTEFKIGWIAGYVGATILLMIVGTDEGAGVAELFGDTVENMATKIVSAGEKVSDFIGKMGSNLMDIIKAWRGMGMSKRVLLISAAFGAAYGAAQLWPGIFGPLFDKGFGFAMLAWSVKGTLDFGFSSKEIAAFNDAEREGMARFAKFTDKDISKVGKDIESYTGIKALSEKKEILRNIFSGLGYGFMDLRVNGYENVIKWVRAYIEKRGEDPSTLFAKAAEKLSGVKGFDRLKASFQKVFRGKWDKNLNIDGILQKTQSEEAELRAAMLAKDKGWNLIELCREKPRGGDVDQILRINGELWYGEVKSDIPSGMSIEDWMTKETTDKNTLYKLLKTDRDLSEGSWEYGGIKNLKIYLPKKYAEYNSELLERINVYKNELGMKDWKIEVVYFEW